MTHLKSIKNSNKDEMCIKIYQNIEHTFYVDATPRHVAVILPHGKNNGWCEKDRYWI